MLGLCSQNGLKTTSWLVEVHCGGGTPAEACTFLFLRCLCLGVGAYGHEGRVGPFFDLLLVDCPWALAGSSPSNTRVIPNSSVG